MVHVSMAAEDGLTRMGCCTGQIVASSAGVHGVRCAQFATSQVLCRMGVSRRSSHQLSDPMMARAAEEDEEEEE